MDLTAVFSHDQIAVMGCFLALAACGLVAATSFRFGPQQKPLNRTRAATAGQIVPARAVVRTQSDSSSGAERKAA